MAWQRLQTPKGTLLVSRAADGIVRLRETEPGKWAVLAVTPIIREPVEGQLATQRQWALDALMAEAKAEVARRGEVWVDAGQEPTP